MSLITCIPHFITSYLCSSNQAELDNLATAFAVQIYICCPQATDILSLVRPTQNSKELRKVAECQTTEKNVVFLSRDDQIRAYNTRLQKHPIFKILIPEDSLGHYNEDVVLGVNQNNNRNNSKTISTLPIQLVPGKQITIINST
jgi:hypothetical protein